MIATHHQEEIVCRILLSTCNTWFHFFRMNQFNKYWCKYLIYVCCDILSINIMGLTQTVLRLGPLCWWMKTKEEMAKNHVHVLHLMNILSWLFFFLLSLLVWAFEHPWFVCTWLLVLWCEMFSWFLGLNLNNAYEHAVMRRALWLLIVLLL